jgi:hypothetical protein
MQKQPWCERERTCLRWKPLGALARSRRRFRSRSRARTAPGSCGSASGTPSPMLPVLAPGHLHWQNTSKSILSYDFNSITSWYLREFHSVGNVTWGHEKQDDEHTDLERQIHYDFLWNIKRVRWNVLAHESRAGVLVIYTSNCIQISLFMLSHS